MVSTMKILPEMHAFLLFAKKIIDKLLYRREKFIELGCLASL